VSLGKALKAIRVVKAMTARESRDGVTKGSTQ
jgi:hypothetical protein